MNEPCDLVLLSKAEKAFAEAKTLDEIKDILDRAAAVKAYTKKARLGQEIAVEAAAIRLRASLPEAIGDNTSSTAKSDAVEWYFVCAECGAKWFSMKKRSRCPRCGTGTVSNEQITPPWRR